MARSELFQPYRALGYVCDDTPMHLKRLGTENFATVSIGSSWQVYNCDKLRLVMVSPQRPERIRAVCSHRDLTFTTAGRRIIVWRRTVQIHELSGHEGDVHILQMFGSFLLSVGEDNRLCMWEVAANGDHARLHDSIDLPVDTASLDSATRRVTCLMHPHTYLNKVCIGFSNGDLELWNLRSKTHLHSFGATLHKSIRNNAGGFTLTIAGQRNALLDQRQVGTPPSITCVEQSPAVDVVAVGMSDGRIVLHNLKFDESVVTFLQDDGAVTTLSFRTDGKFPFLVSGSPQGRLAIWDLKGKKLQTLMKEVHHGPVVSASFLDGEPVLVTTGADNAIKQWIFDQPDHSGRLLRSREGHSAPPTRIRFYSPAVSGGQGLGGVGSGSDGGDATTLLSAGLDRALRYFSVLRDQQAGELSQGSVLAKASKRGVARDNFRLPVITDFFASEAKEKDWANIVTAHEGSNSAHTWRFLHKSLRAGALINKDAPRSEATAVHVSACGNFSLIGYRDGRIEQFNMQSGLHRGSFQMPLPAKSKASSSATKVESRPVSMEAEEEDVPVASSKEHPREKGRFIRPGSIQAIFKAVDQGLDDKHAAAAVKTAAPRMAAVAHMGVVRGVATDGLNRLLVSVGSDAKLKFWNFRTQVLLHTLDLPSPANRLVYNRDSDLFAVVTDDGVVYVFDATTRRMVRRFRGHQEQVTDLAFSPDGRWLVTACMDGSVRVFDLPSAMLVDWFTFSKPPTSVSFSPKSDFLATTHVGSLGIYLWANRSYFANVYLRAAPSEPVDMDLPLAVAKGSSADEAGFSEALSKHDKSVAEAAASARGHAASKDTTKVQYLAANGSSSTGVAPMDSKPDHARDALAGLAPEPSKAGSEAPGSTSALFDDISMTPQPLHLSKVVEDAGTGPYSGRTSAEPLITLSNLPRSRWQHLAVLDIVRERNKPTEAPKAPKSAPFFLPSIGSFAGLEAPNGAPASGVDFFAGGSSGDAAADAKSEDKSSKGSRIIKSQGHRVLSKLAQLLHDAVAATMKPENGKTTTSGKRKAPATGGNANAVSGTGKKPKVSSATSASVASAADPSDANSATDPYAAVTAYLRGLGPSHMDAELRLLAADALHEADDIALMLDYFAAQVHAHTNFEFLQAVLNLFLKIHKDVIVRHPPLLQRVHELGTAQRQAWTHIEEYFNRNLCMLAFFSQTQL